jgi:hypothetical protein
MASRVAGPFFLSRLPNFHADAIRRGLIVSAEGLRRGEQAGGSDELFQFRLICVRSASSWVGRVGHGAVPTITAEGRTGDAGAPRRVELARQLGGGLRPIYAAFMRGRPILSGIYMPS